MFYCVNRDCKSVTAKLKLNVSFADDIHRLTILKNGSS